MVGYQGLSTTNARMWLAFDKGMHVAGWNYFQCKVRNFQQNLFLNGYASIRDRLGRGSSNDKRESELETPTG